MNQAYSRPSTTHGHITDCKLDSVVYAGVCVVSSQRLGEKSEFTTGAHKGSQWNWGKYADVHMCSHRTV